MPDSLQDEDKEWMEKGIKEVNKTITLPNWNKNEPINSEKYKKYKLALTNNGISSKPHYKVFLTIDNEKYYFCLANYDIDNFKKIINYNESIETETIDI